MADQTEFQWTFPCYILAKDFDLDKETGRVVPRDSFAFLTREESLGGERHIAFFTDSHLAEQYLEQCTSSNELRLLEFNNREGAASFLRLAQTQYRMVDVDPSRQKRWSRSFSIDVLLRHFGCD